MGAAGSGSLAALRLTNRHRVVEALRRHGSVSRADLARITGLSHTTVSSLVAELANRGLLAEQPVGGQRAGTGRPPVLLSLAAPARLVDQVLAEAGVDRAGVLGIGMGLPGPVEDATGTIGSSVIMPSWAGLAPAAEFERQVGLPVALDNDANLGALGEVTFGAGRGLSDVV